MGTYERVAGLALTVDDYELEGLSRVVSSGFERLSTVIHLRGDGEEGIGEDVTYEPDEHRVALERGPELGLAGRWSFDGFSEHLGALDLFPGGDPGFPRLPQLPALGLRERRARPRAAPGGALARRGARPRAAARALRRLARGWASRPTIDPVARRLAPTPSCASSSTPRPTGTTR